MSANEETRALRFYQYGEKWVVARNRFEFVEGHDLCESLFKLHVVTTNAVHYIDSVAWPWADAVHNDAGKECSYSEACALDLWKFIKDVKYLLALADEGWRLLKSYDRILARAAGSAVSACGLVGVSGHEVVLRTADQVLRHLPGIVVLGLPSRRSRPSVPNLQEYINSLKPEQVPEEFEAIPKRLRFMNTDELRLLEGQVLREYLLAEAEKPGATRIPPEERTIPMSYRRAAKLIGKGDSKDAAEWLSASVSDGSIRCEHVTRQMHVFSRLDFPEEVWDRITPKSVGSDPKSP